MGSLTLHPGYTSSPAGYIVVGSDERKGHYCSCIIYIRRVVRLLKGAYEMCSLFVFFGRMYGRSRLRSLIRRASSQAQFRFSSPCLYWAWGASARRARRLEFPGTVPFLFTVPLLGPGCVCAAGSVVRVPRHSSVSLHRASTGLGTRGSGHYSCSFAVICK